MMNPDRIVPTTCPYCGVGCNLELHIKNDTIYKVTSPFDGVVNQGNLCVDCTGRDPGRVQDIEGDSSPNAPNGMRQLQFGLRFSF